MRKGIEIFQTFLRKNLFFKKLKPLWKLDFIPSFPFFPIKMLKELCKFRRLHPVPCSDFITAEETL